jgi:hypothetical protein
VVPPLLAFIVRLSLNCIAQKPIPYNLHTGLHHPPALCHAPYTYFSSSLHASLFDLETSYII